MLRVEELADLLLLQQHLLLELAHLIRALEECPSRRLAGGLPLRSAVEDDEANSRLLQMYGDLLPHLERSTLALQKDVEVLRDLLGDLDVDAEDVSRGRRWVN